MANECSGTMKVVCRTENEAAIDRLTRIMKYRDAEWCMYRVFQFEENEREHTEDGLTVATFSTSVAWSGWR